MDQVHHIVQAQDLHHGQVHHPAVQAAQVQALVLEQEQSAGTFY